MYEENQPHIHITNTSVSQTLEYIYALKSRFKCTLVDAVIMYCDQCNLEIDELAITLKKDENFVHALRIEAIEEHQLRGTDGFVKKPSLVDFL